MLICDKCKKRKPTHEISGWIREGKCILIYELCEDCYKQIMDIIAKFKTQASPKGSGA